MPPAESTVIEETTTVTETVETPVETPQTEGDVVFTAAQQKRINVLMGQARDDGRKSGQRELLHDLGAEDVATIKAWRETQTAAQQLQDRLAEAERNLSAERERVQATERDYQRRLKLVDAKMVASTLRFNDPDDAVRYLDDVDAMELDKNGRVVGLDEALQKLATDKPWLVQGTRTVVPPTPEGRDPEHETKAEREARQRAFGQSIKNFF